MKLLKTPYGYYDITTRAHYEITYFEARFNADKRDEWYVRVEHPECDKDGDRVHNTLSPAFFTRAEALTELDRIAALIEGKAPAQGWVAGAPPLVDGKWFLAMHQGEPVAVHCHAPNDLPWTDSAGNDYPSSEFTHHIPTPIQPPKES